MMPHTQLYYTFVICDKPDAKGLQVGQMHNSNWS